MAETWENLHNGDYGWTGQVQVNKNGSPLPIGSYTTRKLIMIPPSGIGDKKEHDINFVTDGSDGLLARTFVQDDIDQAGDWEVFVRLTKTGAQLTSSKFSVLFAERADEGES